MKERISERIGRTLRSVDEAIPPKRMEALREDVRREIRRRQRREHMRFGRFLLMQVRFSGWRIWLAQFAAFALLCLFQTASMGEYYWKNPCFAPMLLCCAPVLMLMAVLLFLHRARRYRMHEIEAATFFSSARLLAAQLILIGAGDMAMLGVFLHIVARSAALQPGIAALYMLLPYLIVCGGCLYALGRIPENWFLPCGFGGCAALLLAFLLMERTVPAFYTHVRSPAWLGACAALLLFCLRQLRFIFSRPDFAEMRCGR